jgi:hypothetical protein
MKEYFKDVPGYEGYYQVSSFGVVKSLQRKVNDKGFLRNQRGIILKQRLDCNGYYFVELSKGNKRKSIKVHQLVAMAFLNHIPCGYQVVVDHKDNNRLNNKLNNLQLISHRENNSKDRYRTKKSGLPLGVYFEKSRNKYKASIRINGKSITIGRFNCPTVAHFAYQKALSEIKN